jgi:hypothetical protein
MHNSKEALQKTTTVKSFLALENLEILFESLKFHTSESKLALF